MPSQTDLDQGGTNRQWIPQWLGPSVGWIWVPALNILPITVGGTFQLDPSTSLVQVNTTGSVTIRLPSAIDPPAGPMSQTGLFANNPITIVDVGGNAGAHPITITPISPNPNGESIMGLASISLSVNYGGYTLLPNSANKTWNSISP
jgi:hypothetical protein